MDFLIEKENGIERKNEIIKVGKDYSEFNKIMELYKRALDETFQRFTDLKQYLNNNSSYEIINNVTYRIKSPDSILNKMKKKKYKLNYENMIEKINDIAGLRIICNFEDDIYKIRDIIRLNKEIRVLKEKDYIKNKKKSGYSAYHMIVEVPIEVKNEILFVKIEIQIRTILMDFWSSTEHSVKYKPNKKLSKFDSFKLSFYAKVINSIDANMAKIYRRQNNL